jgi:hypothetical protein
MEKIRAVVKALDALTNDPAIRARCDAWARRLATERPGTEVAAEAIVALAARRGVADHEPASTPA